MSAVAIHELSHNTSRYLSKVRAGESLTITDHGRVIAVVSPAGESANVERPRPRLGGYRSQAPLTAEEIDAELNQGFGSDDSR